MKKILIFASALLLTHLLVAAEGTSWNTVQLPHFFTYPCDNPPCKPQSSNGYGTQFPTAPVMWHYEKECDKYRMTSTRWISDLLFNVRGISFKGIIYKQALGNRLNEFALFYHEEPCYKGGPEYGWVFPHTTYGGYFYLCGNCNMPDQKWCQWPGDCAASGDCKEVEEALKNPAKEHYWNIKVQPDGNFLIEIVDPATWKIASCLINKPDWLENLYGHNGYITINAQKNSNEVGSDDAFMSIDEAKIWQ